MLKITTWQVSAVIRIRADRSRSWISSWIRVHRSLKHLLGVTAFWCSFTKRKNCTNVVVLFFRHRAVPEDEAHQSFSELPTHCVHEPSDDALQPNAGIDSLSQCCQHQTSFSLYCKHNEMLCHSVCSESQCKGLKEKISIYVITKGKWHY